MTRHFTLTFILGTALLLLGGLFHAHAEEEYKETWIYSWCKSPSVFERVHELAKQGDAEAGFQYYVMAVRLKHCVDVSRFGGVVSFKMTGIVKEYDINPDGSKQETLVVEGNLVNNDNTLDPETVYVWIGKENLPNFKNMDAPADIPKQGAEFKGWQNT